MLSISQVANKLKVNKKTLMRWDTSGKFPALRDSSGNRAYDELDIQNHAQWFELRRKHRAHNRILTAIRQEADHFLVTQPLGMQNPVFHKIDEMKKTYAAMNRWRQKSQMIIDEYSKLPPGFKAKLDPDA